MPIYEYRCEDCQSEFELLVRGSDRPVCPQCGGQRLDQQLSVPAAHASKSSSLPVCRPPSPAAGCGLPQCGMGQCQRGG